MKKIILFAIFLFIIFSKQSQADITLENGYISLSFHDSTFALRSITDLSNGSNIFFEERESPIWQVTFLNTQEDSIKTSDLYTRSSFDFSSTHSFIIEDKIEGKLLTLFWTDMEFYPGDSLDVKVTVLLPINKNKSVWNIEVHNSSDQYGTFSVDFPFITIQPIAGDGNNDMLLLPSQSGSLFEDPIANARIAVNNSTDLSGLSSNNEYPGMTGMQFFYLYDKDTEQGLYFATDDTAGYARRYAFYGNENNNILYFTIRHYPENHNQINFSYRPPYQVMLQPFAGDWIDAAKYYRQWALQQPWCQQGPLYQRLDFNPEVGESAFILTVHGTKMGGDVQLIVDRVKEQNEFFKDPKFFIHLRGWNWGYFLVNSQPKPGVVELVDSLTQAGFRVAPYTSTQDWHPNFFPHPIGDAGVAKNINGDILYIEKFNANIMCAGSDTWQDYYPRQVNEMMRQLGATDIYLDNYPSHKFCYVADHGHALGGGAHWSRGYKTFMNRIRNSHPGSLMGNEGKYEQLIPYLDGFYSPLWTGAGGPDENERPFCMPGSFPVPLVQCVYHDYIIPFGSTGGYYEEYVPGQYAFEQAYAFVNGNALDVKNDSSSIARFSSEKLDDWKFNQKMVQTFSFARQYLRYGEWMRPPTMNVPTTTVHFAYSDPHYEAVEQPQILAACFKAPDHSLGLAFANYTSENVSGSFFVNLDDYNLPAGAYTVNLIDTSGVHDFDQFNGGIYAAQLTMNAKSVIIFEIARLTGVDLKNHTLISEFQLQQNYPNPFNSSTVISYQLSTNSFVELEIYNELGQKIRSVEAGLKTKGTHSALWDGKNDAGNAIASGIYFYRIKTKHNFSEMKKLIILK